MAIVEGIMAGVSIAEGIFGASSKRKAARANMESIDKQLDILNQTKTSLGKAFESEKGFVTDRYGNVVSSLISDVGLSMEGLNANMDRAVSRSNLAFSGNISDRFSLANRELTNKFQSGMETQKFNFQNTILDITKQYQSNIADLNAQREQLLGERKVYEQQSKSRFLGIF